MTEGELSAIAALLGETFPDAPKLQDPAYLSWLYTGGPAGPVISRESRDEDGLTGHYAVVPFDVETGEETRRAALSLNTAVHARARGGGLFVQLANETYEDAAEAGIEFVFGVANANSTPGFVGRLGFQTPGSLPVTILVPHPGRGRVRFRREWAGAPTASGLLSDVPSTRPPAGGFQRRWTRESLTWRLAAPHGRYALHVADGVVMVTTKEQRGPIRFAILLAILTDRTLTGAEAAALTREACRFHRAPLALHAGINRRVPLRGLPLPERLKPSPLNLIVRPLVPDASPRLTPSRFEFLDFDAY